MEVNILQVLSPMQKQIYIAACRGETYGQIAKRLGIGRDTVKTHWKRIQKKIEELEKSHIDVIMDIFEEESNRSLPKNHTVSQMQFLTQTDNMHTTEGPSPALKSYYRKKTEDVRTTTRRMTLEEREYWESQERPGQSEPIVPHDVIRLEREYRFLLTDPDTPTEIMARMEVILRAYGILYFTPSINKLNAKTSKALRAKEEGFDPTLVKPGEGKLLPQGSKFLESVKGDDGKAEYSVWLVPKGTRITAPQQETL